MFIQRKPQGVLPHFLRGGKQNGGMIRAAEFLHDLFLRRGKVCVIEMFRLAVPVCRRLGAVRNCRAPQHHLIALLFRHTTTLGVREAELRRHVLTRTVTEVETPFGTLRRKDAAGYGVTRSKYEYDDLCRAARESGLSLTELRKKLP